MSDQTGLPIYLVNLDRRSDRLAHMSSQLQGMGLSFTRIPAVDASLGENVIDPRISKTNHLIPMGLGSRAYATTMLQIFTRIANQPAPAAILLQDDADLSPDLAKFAANISWLPSEIGLVQMEKWVERRGEKLLGPGSEVDVCAGRKLHRLFSRTGGAACFLIRKEAAAIIVGNMNELRFPADHLLFSPNVSPFFDRMGVAMILPCLAIQRVGEHGSDLDQWRRKMTTGEKLRRGATELNRVPRQLADMAFRKARWIDTTYAESTHGIETNSNGDH